MRILPLYVYIMSSVYRTRRVWSSLQGKLSSQSGLSHETANVCFIGWQATAVNGRSDALNGDELLVTMQAHPGS